MDIAQEKQEDNCQATKAFKGQISLLISKIIIEPRNKLVMFYVWSMAQRPGH